MFRLDIEKVVRYFRPHRRPLSTRPWLFSGDALSEAGQLCPHLRISDDTPTKLRFQQQSLIQAKPEGGKRGRSVGAQAGLRILGDVLRQLESPRQCPPARHDFLYQADCLRAAGIDSDASLNQPQGVAL